VPLGVLSTIPLDVSGSIGIAANIFNYSTHGQKAGFTSWLCYPMHSHNCANWLEARRDPRAGLKDVSKKYCISFQSNPTSLVTHPSA